MIDTIVKKYLKGKTFTCTGYGLTISYKVNVNVKIDSRHWRGEYKYIDLNIKVIECVRDFGRYSQPVFQVVELIRTLIEMYRILLDKI
jgi:hypothetical protein